MNIKYIENLLHELASNEACQQALKSNDLLELYKNVTDASALTWYMIKNGEDPLSKKYKLSSVPMYAFAELDGFHYNFPKDCEVKVIGVRAFAECKCLKNVTVPNTVEHIGANAFEQSTVETVDCSSTAIVSVEPWAFSTCKFLKSVKFGSVENISDRAFVDCDELEDVDFGTSKIKTIGKRAFANTDIANVRLNAGDVQSGAFAESGVESVDIVADSIGFTAFSSCKYLEKVKLDCECIDEGAFEYCYSLKEVYLTDRLQTVGNEVFTGCYSLSKIIFDGTEQEWESKNLWDMFDDKDIEIEFLK